MLPRSAHPGLLLLALIAACGGNTPTAIVPPPPPPPIDRFASITIAAPREDTLTLVGLGVVLHATVKDTTQATVTDATVTWSSSNPAIVPITSNGLITAASWGTATITAQAGTRRDSIHVIVHLDGPVGGPLTGTTFPCEGGHAGQFPCSGIDLLSFVPVSALGVGPGNDIDDLWGWTDPSNGKEYVMVGRRDGVAFVDLSTPSTPKYVGFLPISATAHPNVWHDIKVYHDYAFAVADGAGQNGMQVFDLHQLRNYTGTPLLFSPAATYTNVASVHNIVIDTASGFAYLVGSNGGGTTCGGGLHMVDIHSPTAPVFAGCFADVTTGRAHTGYTHDAECVMYHGPDATYTGHEICFGMNETAISIADVTSKATPVKLSTGTYPSVAYTHQGWLTDDQRYLYVNDELDEESGGAAFTRTLIWDVADLGDPVLAAQYFGPTAATDHNNYILGDRLYASNYQFGVRVISIADRTHPQQLGYFDTAPEYPDTPGFGGSWSNYPYFKSGILVVTSREEGLFVLRVH